MRYPRVTHSVLVVLTLATANGARAAPLVVETRVGTGDWSRATTVEARAGEPIELRLDAPDGAEVRWFELLPDLDRDRHNVEWPWDPQSYRWRGYERAGCSRSEIVEWRGRTHVTLPWAVPPELPSSFNDERPGFRRRDIGTFWLQAEVTIDGKVSRTAGPGRDPRGLPARTLRVSVREGDDLLGWMSTFYNVPAVFGSTPHQSRNRIGGDAADVVMTARSLWLGEPLGREWSVPAIVAALARRGEAEVIGGVPTRPVRWGEDVRPGDLIAVRYPGWRRYGHVGVLHSDGDGDGMLGPADRVLTAGPTPLALAQLGEGGFDGQVVFLDPATRVPARSKARARK